MVLNDLIKEVIQKKESDGCGGARTVGKEEREIECKVSLNTKPELMNAYGQSGQQILYVVTIDPLDKDAIYQYNNNNFNVRFNTKNNRFSFSTLVEIK